MKNILVLCLVVGSFAGSSEEYIDSLRSTDFGKTVIQTIQLELGQEEGGATVNRVLALLHQMKDDIAADQESDGASLQSRQDQCSSKAGEAQGVATQAAQRKANDERSVPLIEEELRDKQNQVLGKREEAQRNSDRIAALTETRKRTRGEFEAKREELTQIIGALQEAKQIIAQLKTNGFLQLNDGVLAQIKSHHEKFLKSLPHTKGYYNLVNVLLETMQKHSDQGAVDRLLTVLDELMEAVYNSQKQEMRADDQRQQDFLNQKTRIEWQNSRIESSTAHLRADVEVLKQKLLELENDISTQQQIIDAKSTERDDWTKTCSDAQAAFSRISDNRKEQLEIITRCIEIFETNAFDATSYIQTLHVR